MQNIHDNIITLQGHEFEAELTHGRRISRSPMPSEAIVSLNYVEVDDEALVGLNSRATLYTNKLPPTGSTAAVRSLSCGRNDDVLGDEEEVEVAAATDLELVPAPVLDPADVQRVITCKIKKLKLENRLENVLLSHWAVFSGNKYDSGKLKTPIDFNFDPNFPRQYKTYPLSDEKRKYLTESLNKLVFHGKIERSPDTFGSPIFILPKKSAPGQEKQFRLIVDARKLASSIDFGQSSAIQGTHSILTELSRCQYLTSVDLCKAYYGLTVSDRIVKSGFNNIISDVGCFRIKSVLTGSNFAPNELNSIMKRELDTNEMGEYDPISTSKVSRFFDDIALGTEPMLDGYTTHLSDLDTLFRRIKKSGLKVAIEKCSFAVDLRHEKVKCLGFMLGDNKIQPDDEKLQAIQALNIPKTLKELQSACGMLQYIRHILPIKVGGLLTLLNDYCSPEKFSVDDNFVAIFNDLKKGLVDLTVDMPFADGTFFLYSDASNFALGGVLLNVDNQAMYNSLKGSTHDKTNLDLRHNTAFYRQNIDNHNEMWVRQLEIIKVDRSILNILHHFVTLIDERTWSGDSLKQCLHRRIFDNCQIFSLLLPLECPEDRREFFAKVYHCNTLNYEECVMDAYTTMLLLAFSDVFRRDILVVGESYFKIGRGNFRSPLIVSTLKGEILSLGSETDFLTFKSTYQKYVENMKADCAAAQFARILKKKEARESIRVLGFHTKKFSATELNRPIYHKELHSIYMNLKFFSEIIRSSKCIVLTDSMPSKQLIRSAETREVSVFTTVARLINEFPSVQISYCPGADNISDLFSRQFV